MRPGFCCEPGFHAKNFEQLSPQVLPGDRALLDYNRLLAERADGA